MDYQENENIEIITDAEILDEDSVYAKVRNAIRSKMFLAASIILAVGNGISVLFSGGAGAVTLLVPLCLLWMYHNAQKDNRKKLMEGFSALKYYFIAMAVLAVLVVTAVIFLSGYLASNWEEIRWLGTDDKLAILNTRGVGFWRMIIGVMTIAVAIVSLIAGVVSYVVFFFKMHKLIKCIKGNEPSKVPCTAFIVLIWVLTVINIDFLMVLGSVLLTAVLVRLQKALKN